MPWTSPTTRASLYAVTAANWNELVTDLLFLKEIGYAEATAAASVTATTIGTAVQLVTLGAITYEAVPTMIEFGSPRITNGTGTARIVLRDGTTVLGTLGEFPPSTSWTTCISRRLTPTAASHSYNVAAWVTTGTVVINGGSGGAAGDNTTFLPMWIRAARIPT